MNALLQLIDRGGLVMIAIIALSAVLYSRCFALLLELRRVRRSFRATPVSTGTLSPHPEYIAKEVLDRFRQQRVVLGAMIAAAPLLGLLGTVRGMEETFASLSGRAGEKSMEGLARGISEVLVATESGLAVAIPAMLFVYWAHRESHRCVQALNRALAETKGAEL